jgi:hypothetical protein
MADLWQKVTHRFRADCDTTGAEGERHVRHSSRAVWCTCRAAHCSRSDGYRRLVRANWEGEGLCLCVCWRRVALMLLCLFAASLSFFAFLSCINTHTSPSVQEGNCSSAFTTLLVPFTFSTAEETLTPQALAENLLSRFIFLVRVMHSFQITATSHIPPHPKNSLSQTGGCCTVHWLISPLECRKTGQSSRCGSARVCRWTWWSCLSIFANCWATG